MDLNIENYDLDDILNLFKIPKNFTEEDLKSAKKIVLKTHHPNIFDFILTHIKRFILFGNLNHPHQRTKI